MSDLSIEYFSVCPSVFNFETHIEGKTGDYEVIYGPTPNGKYTHGWSCTCQHFRYRKTECRHIREAKEERCAWNQEALCGSGAPRPADDKCPNCGQTLETIKVAV